MFDVFGHDPDCPHIGYMKLHGIEVRVPARIFVPQHYMRWCWDCLDRLLKSAIHCPICEEHLKKPDSLREHEAGILGEWEYPWEDRGNHRVRTLPFGAVSQAWGRTRVNDLFIHRIYYYCHLCNLFVHKKCHVEHGCPTHPRLVSCLKKAFRSVLSRSLFGNNVADIMT